MTLSIYDFEQRSPEWYAARRGILTASTIGQLITAKTMKPAANDYSRALIAQLVAERITGWTEETFTSADMWRGIEDEPRALDVYTQHYAPVTTVGFMVRDLGVGELGYSPDGLVDHDGLIEVKSRRPKKHVQTILADEVPIENMAQIQGGLLVSGRAFCDYISYCGGMPMWVKRVLPDPAWFDAITAVVETFEQTASQMVTNYQTAIEGLPMTERIETLEMVI